MILLWLDDWRDPKLNAEASDLEEYEQIIWVKSVEAFKGWIDANGLPDKISFDYCLGTDLDMFDDGIGAAKRVINYCIQNGTMDNPLPFPVFAIHSDHPEAFRLNDYILRNVDLYDLGEARQEGKVHVKSETKEDGKLKTYLNHTTLIQPHVPLAYSNRSGKPTARKQYHSTPRNEKCPCGSEKKYKRCCIGK